MPSVARITVRPHRGGLLFALFALALAATAAVLVAGASAARSAPAKLKVFGAFATPIEEPWDGVIHAALTKAKKAGQIDYAFTDDIGYSGNMERVLRQVAAKNKPDIIFGDAFGNEEAVRRVASAFPKIAFVFGSETHSSFGPVLSATVLGQFFNNVLPAGAVVLQSHALTLRRVALSRRATLRPERHAAGAAAGLQNR